MRGMLIALAFAVMIILSACNLNTVPPTPIPTPDLPRVYFEYPSNNDQVFLNTDLTVDIVAQDESVGISRLIFSVDGEVIQDVQPPDEMVTIFRVNMNWLAEGLGLHTLSAIAYRPSGTQSDEAIITIEVIPR